MKKKFAKKFLLVWPVVILIIMLFFIDYTIKYFKESTYKFVFNTNVDSVKNFSNELQELNSLGYVTQEYKELYNHIIRAYNKTFGEKYAIITFLLDEYGNIYHSNNDNELYVSELLKNKSNDNLVKQVASSHGTGCIELDDRGRMQTWFYQVFTDGSNDYYIFMSVNKQLIQEQLNVDEIIILMSTVGIILLLSIEYSVWLRAVCDCKKKRVK